MRKLDQINTKQKPEANCLLAVMTAPASVHIRVTEGNGKRKMVLSMVLAAVDRVTMWNGLLCDQWMPGILLMPRNFIFLAPPWIWVNARNGHELMGWHLIWVFKYDAFYGLSILCRARKRFWMLLFGSGGRMTYDMEWEIWQSYNIYFMG